MLPPPSLAGSSTDLNDRNVHEISISSNVIFEHNLSINGRQRREVERGGEIFAIDLTSQEVSFVLVFVQKAVLPAKNGSIR